MSDGGANGSMPGSEEGGLNEQMRSPGARLAAYRAEQGWTIEQVAGQLNLAPRQVRAIENDDYPALPPLAILRGFVRSYAKLLKVDPAPLLAQIGGGTMVATEPPAQRRASSVRFYEQRFPSIADRRGPSAKRFAALALAVAVLAGAWALWSPTSVDTFASLFGKLEMEWANASGSEPAAPVAIPASPGDARATAPEPASGMISETTVQAPAFRTPDAAAPPPVVPQAATPTQAPPQTPHHVSRAPEVPQTLVLKVRRDSWLQVKRAASNTSILSRIVKAGETETIEIKEPLFVVIGNVNGVDATLRGKPLEIKANTSNNIARLSLK
jgi:cytoskeleton protein RodZ